MSSRETEYDLTLKLYETDAEAAYLSGEFDRMESAIEVVKNNARSLLDRIPVYEIQIKALGAQNKSLEAVQIILRLQGIDYHWHNGLGEKYDETEILVDNDVTGLFHLHFSNLILNYFKQDFATAIDNANDAEQYLAGVAGQMVVPQFHFYDSLARLADFIDSNEAEQQEILEKTGFSQILNHSSCHFLRKCVFVSGFDVGK